MLVTGFVGFSPYLFADSRSAEGLRAPAGMLDASAIPDADKESLGIMAELYDRETVGWIADDIAYLLVGSKPGVVVGPYAPGADLRVALHRLRSRT